MGIYKKLTISITMIITLTVITISIIKIKMLKQQSTHTNRIIHDVYTTTLPTINIHNVETTNYMNQISKARRKEIVTTRSKAFVFTSDMEEITSKVEPVQYIAQLCRVIANKYTIHQGIRLPQGRNTVLSDNRHVVTSPQTPVRVNLSR